MKKTQKTMLTAAILTAAIGFTGCDNHDDMQNVYGPPPDMGTSAPTTTYDPVKDRDDMQDVYGPPPDMNISAATTDYDPADDEPQPEYGADIAYERTEE